MLIFLIKLDLGVRERRRDEPSCLDDELESIVAYLVEHKGNNGALSFILEQNKQLDEDTVIMDPYSP